MRESATRFKCKRLFIFGAGASYAASAGGTQKAPLDFEFNRTISELNYDRPQWIDHAKRSVLNAYKGPGAFKDAGLEESVIRQLGHLEFLNRIHPKRAKGLQTSDEYLDHLNRLICTVLSRCRNANTEYYERLAKIICSKAKDLDSCGDRIITFNYDTLLDNKLYEYFDWNGLYFDDFRDSISAKPPIATSSPLLLKLHGSINWRCDKTEYFAGLHHDRTEDNPYEIPLIWHDASRPDPESGYAPLIVPPLPSKPITSIKIFRYLWTKAYEYLHEASELYIVGYSLPPTDSMAISLFSNFTNTNLKTIYVADPNGAMLNKWRTVLNHKGSESIEWKYAEDFGEMISYLE